MCHLSTATLDLLYVLYANASNSAYEAGANWRVYAVIVERIGNEIERRYRA